MSKSYRKRSLTEPKFSALKETFSTFKKRLERISTDTDFQKNFHRLRYFNKIEKLCNRVHKLLQSYPQYESEPDDHDPATAMIPEELAESMKFLSQPPKKYLKVTLKQINRMLEVVLDGDRNQKDAQTKNRVEELLKCRMHVCCLLRQYPQSPEPSSYCFRFNPFSTKPAPIYAVKKSSKNPKRRIKIQSRILEFDFDVTTDALAIPSLHQVKAAFEFHCCLIQRICYQYYAFRDTKDQKRKLVKILQNLIKRRDLLGRLKAEIEKRRKLETEIDEAPCDGGRTKKEVQGRFSKLFKNFQPFSHCIELPSRSKLKEMLEFHKQLLRKETERLVPPSNHTQRDKPDEKSRRRSFKDRLKNNIKFIESVLESYPTPEKPPHCLMPEESHRFRSSDKKQLSVKISTDEAGKAKKNYEFDDATNKLAFPKMSILKGAAMTNQELLQKFLSDTRSLDALNQKLQEIKSKENVNGAKKIPSIRQQKKQMELKAAERARRCHEDLDGRTKRLVELIKQQSEKIEKLQSKTDTNTGPSDFYHHIVCHAEQEVDKLKEYQMKKPHETVCTSLATKHRLLASLEKYRNLVKLGKRKITCKDRAERISKKVEETKQEEDLQRKSTNEGQEQFVVEPSVDEPPEDQPQIEMKNTEESTETSHHTTRLIHNMEVLETLLKDYPTASEDSHLKSHKKLSEKPFEHKKGNIDIQRTNEMAKPRKVLLKSTLESHRKLMSREKQERIEKELGTSATSADDLEKTVKNSPGDWKRLERENAMWRMQKIEKKVASAVFDEIANNLLKKLPGMIMNRSEPMMLTSFMRELQQKAYKFIIAANGRPNSEEENQLYQSLAGIVCDFIVKIKTDFLADLMPPKEEPKLKRFKRLKAAEKHRELIETAEYILRKFQ